MLISASYKTDIPAFYGQWLMNRLRAGFCTMFNPYNRRPIHVSLAPADVDGIVFWTKNITPFLKHLPQVQRLGLPFVVQYGINGYPRELESAVIDPDRSIRNVRKIADDFGPAVCVWRYDTILLTSLTPPDFHLRNFARIARELAGATDEVVISFAQFYQKTLRHLTRAAAECNFTWHDPAADEKRRLASALARIAGEHGLRLSICAQYNYLVPGAHNARCIDAGRFQRITGKPLSIKLHGNRKECGCHQCRDIGEYDTCPHGCVYCYAVRNPLLARQHFQRHDPDSESLCSLKL